MEAQPVDDSFGKLKESAGAPRQLERPREPKLVPATVAGTYEVAADKTAKRVLDTLAKRALDIVVAAFALALLAPVFLCVAIAIKVDSRGSVFYRCRRVGFRGRTFNMLKFRKMHENAAGPALTAADDVRFTSAGRFLAKSKLDELPQLWNVLKGDMSLVGPRPEDPSFVALRPDAYRCILTVRPGVTGLCQLAFAKESEVIAGEDRVAYYVARLLPQKAAMDQLYAAQRSFMMDLRILVWTAAAVLFRRDVAVDRATGRLTARRRPPEVVALADAEMS